MVTDEYRTWAGATKTVQADRVEFKPFHVVFRRFDHSIVLAEPNTNVNGLTQLTEDTDDDMTAAEFDRRRAAGTPVTPGFCTRDRNCRMSEGHDGGCQP